MSRKIISLFTLLAFIIFSISCYTTSTKDVRTVVGWKGKRMKILGVVKLSGEHIEFHKDRPGRIYKDSIGGAVRKLRKEMEIDRADIKDIIRDEKGKILVITKKDDKIYHLFIDVTSTGGRIIHHLFTGKAREEEDKIILSGEFYESISIPLSEVKYIRVKRANLRRSLLAVVGSVAGVVALGFVILFVAYLLEGGEE